MDLQAVKASKCFLCVLPVWSFHSSGSFGFLFRSLLSLALVSTSLSDAFLAMTTTVLFVDSTIAAYLLYAVSCQALAATSRASNLSALANVVA